MYSKSFTMCLESSGDITDKLIVEKETSKELRNLPYHRFGVHQKPWWLCYLVLNIKIYWVFKLNGHCIVDYHFDDHPPFSTEIRDGTLLRRTDQNLHLWKQHNGLGSRVHSFYLSAPRHIGLPLLEIKPTNSGLWSQTEACEVSCSY